LRAFYACIILLILCRGTDESSADTRLSITDGTDSLVRIRVAIVIVFASGNTYSILSSWVTAKWKRIRTSRGRCASNSDGHACSSEISITKSANRSINIRNTVSITCASSYADGSSSTGVQTERKTGIITARGGRADNSFCHYALSKRANRSIKVRSTIKITDTSGNTDSLRSIRIATEGKSWILTSRGSCARSGSYVCYALSESGGIKRANRSIDIRDTIIISCASYNTNCRRSIRIETEG